MRFTRSHRVGVALVASLALVGSLSSCVQSEREEGGGTGGTSGESSSAGGSFVFAASSDPASLDPALASDGETFRPSRQMFEGLVANKEGSIELEPKLATKWEAAADGKTFTFTLRQGVKFHDGTDFNAEAVCANFERWYNWTGLNQNQNITAYYNDVFKGFKTGKTGGIYSSCAPKGSDQVTIKLNKAFASFVSAMTLPSFSMQSPTAMKQYNADNTGGTETDVRFSSYATEHPSGTGPFKFSKWERGQAVTLVRNDEYWGEKAKSAQVIIRTISDAKARTQELQAGSIDGYDLVGPADVAPLKQAGFQVLARPAFNILYLGFNQKNKALSDVRVRQAINYAVDKQAVVKTTLPEGSVVAKEFMPSMVDGYNDEVEDYAYDLEKAKALLKEAGQSSLTLNFAYPTGVSRPYMPTPEDTFTILKSQLEKAGITVKPVSAKWSPDYLDLVQSKEGADKHDLHLLGWTGDYNSPDNFIGVFFSSEKDEWGFNNKKLFSDLATAKAISTEAELVTAYKKLNAEIAEFAPGVPIAHPAPSLAFSKGVQGFVPSPTQDEVWNNITVSK